MILVSMSDSHGRHDNIYQLKNGENINNQEVLNNISGGVYLPADIDILIHSGDISMRGNEQEVDCFLKWFSSIKAKNRCLIAGNHDKLFEKQRVISQELIKKYPNIIYLESQEIVIDGIKIYGEPRQPTFGYDWAFNVQRGEKIKQFWDAVPDDVHILVTHGPPKGILDMTMRGEQVGCEDLLFRVMELKDLKLCQFGHIHEHAGYEFINGVHFVNASVVNLRYQLQNKPMMFEIDENKNITKIDIMEQMTKEGQEFLDSLNGANEALGFKKIELPENSIKPEIAFEDLMKADIRICEILSVEKVEKKDRLYKLKINTGFDKRVVVSSIAHKIKPEQLLNKKFPFVLNLAPRPIANIVSQAMIILSEGSGGNLYEVGDQDVEVGSIVI